MVSAIALIALYLTGTCSALNFHSPVRFVRPLNDVHAECERDVEIFCGPQDQSGEEKIRRRLAEAEYVEQSKSRRISLRIGLTFTPKDGKELSQFAKDTKRFLNYGPDMDNCLWNAFDAQKVSNKCASALKYVNDSIDAMQAKYDSESENTTTTYRSVSLSVSSGLLCSLIFLCIVYKSITCDEEDEEDDVADSDAIHSSEKVAFVAIPLTVV